jgi:hypothetical protein
MELREVMQLISARKFLNFGKINWFRWYAEFYAGRDSVCDLEFEEAMKKNLGWILSWLLLMWLMLILS